MMPSNRKMRKTSEEAGEEVKRMTMITTDRKGITAVVASCPRFQLVYSMSIMLHFHLPSELVLLHREVVCKYYDCAIQDLFSTI